MAVSHSLQQGVVMPVRTLRWFRHHPILTALLTLFTYAWIKWMTLPPDWYIIHTFPWKKDVLERLVMMLKEDVTSYGHIILHPHERCCGVRLDDFGNVKRSMTSGQIPESRIQEYVKLMRSAGVLDIGLLRQGFDQVWVSIDYYFVGGSVNYVYSNEPLVDCAKMLNEISGGMPAYDCIMLDEHWYLFHI